MKRTTSLLFISVLFKHAYCFGAALMLHDAASQANVEEVQRLVTEFPSSEYINALNADGLNALHCAQFEKFILINRYSEACEKWGEGAVDKYIARYKQIERFLKNNGALQYPTPPNEAPTRPSTPENGDLQNNEIEEMNGVAQKIVIRFQQKQEQKQHENSRQAVGLSSVTEDVSDKRENMEQRCIRVRRKRKREKVLESTKPPPGSFSAYMQRKIEQQNAKRQEEKELQPDVQGCARGRKCFEPTPGSSSAYVRRKVEQERMKKKLKRRKNDAL